MHYREALQAHWLSTSALHCLLYVQQLHSWPAPGTQSGALLQAGHGGSIWQNAAQNVTFYNNVISTGLAVNGSGGLEMLSTNLTAFDSNTFINNLGTQGAGGLSYPMCSPSARLFLSHLRGTVRRLPALSLGQRPHSSSALATICTSAQLFNGILLWQLAGATSSHLPTSSS